MKNRFYTVPLKLLAAVLLFASIILALGSGAAILSLSESGAYYRTEREFSQSDLFLEECNHYLNQVKWYGERILEGTVSASDSESDAFIDTEDSNFRYAVYSKDGQLLSQNGEFSGGIVYEDDKVSIRYSVETEQPVHDSFYYLRLMYDNRSTFIVIFAIFGLLSLVLLTFLLCGAGRRRGEEGTALSAVDKLPLDVFVALSVLACVGFAFICESIRWYAVLLAPFVVLLYTLGLELLVTVSARLKAGTLIKNNLSVRLLCMLWRGIRALLRAVRRFLGSMSFFWQALLICVGYGLISLVLNVIAVSERSEFALFFWLLLTAAVTVFVCKRALDLKLLAGKAKNIANGDFTSPLETDKMLSDYKTLGSSLKSIGSGMDKALFERMKSERMKTDLIANVSHDLKTPLTSIINYVDLLEKADISGENVQEYLEVLSRQSQRLKKLTEDLIEASKASSGVIEPDMTRVSVSELLRQAVAEYSERMSAARLEVVCDCGDELYAMADGRLLWRVFDNLLSNARKYSLEGTRVYVKAFGNADSVTVSFRNVSREALNLSGEELMERFVRGDASRSTEGSGLGLSIAKSLMELQGGVLRITAEADMFKADASVKRA